MCFFWLTKYKKNYQKNLIPLVTLFSVSFGFKWFVAFFHTGYGLKLQALLQSCFKSSKDY